MLSLLGSAVVVIVQVFDRYPHGALLLCLCGVVAAQLIEAWNGGKGSQRGRKGARKKDKPGQPGDD